MHHLPEPDMQTFRKDEQPSREGIGSLSDPMIKGSLSTNIASNGKKRSGRSTMVAFRYLI
jgi:hypothetical protein